MDPVRVELGACRCEGAPHTVDWVDLAPKLTISMGIAASSVIDGATDVPDMLGRLGNIYLRQGIVGWSFAEPVTPEAIERLLPWADGGMTVADRCDNLYSEDFLRPLALRWKARSQPGPTAPSTSANDTSGPASLTPSAPSLPANRAGRRSVARGLSPSARPS